MRNEANAKKTIYLDATALSGAWGVISQDAEIIQAGTTVYSMPVSDKNAEYDRWAAEYDICFIFDDCAVEPDFYAVPRFDIFATDSRGGYIGTIGACTDLQGEEPVAYIDREKNVFLLAQNGAEFMCRAPQWRKYLEPWEGIKLYKSKVAADAELEFCILPEME